MNKFWAVVNLSEHPMRFTYRHDTEESAMQESGRLARQNRGHKFAVLALVGWSGQADIPVSWNLPDGPEPPTQQDIDDQDAMHAAHPVFSPNASPQDEWPEITGDDGTTEW